MVVVGLIDYQQNPLGGWVRLIRVRSGNLVFRNHGLSLRLSAERDRPHIVHIQASALGESRMKRYAQQSHLSAERHASTNIEERRRQYRTALQNTNGPRLLDDKQSPCAIVRRLQIHWAGKPGDHGRERHAVRRRRGWRRGSCCPRTAST